MLQWIVHVCGSV